MSEYYNVFDTKTDRNYFQLDFSLNKPKNC